MLKKTFSFLILIFFSNYSLALYFHISETERKCFIEEIPDKTTVLVNFKFEVIDSKTGNIMESNQGMHVEVKDPNMKVIHSMVYYNSSEGRIFFTSNLPGEHVISLYSNSTIWIRGTQLRVHLNIQVEKHALNYSNMAQKDKLEIVQLRMRQLLDKVDAITKEQNYQRYREQRFRMTSESTDRMVFWWSLAQLFVLISIMSIWQIYFFIKSFINNIILII